MKTLINYEKVSLLLFIFLISKIANAADFEPSNHNFENPPIIPEIEFGADQWNPLMKINGNECFLGMTNFRNFISSEIGPDEDCLAEYPPSMELSIGNLANGSTFAADFLVSESFNIFDMKNIKVMMTGEVENFTVSLYTNDYNRPDDLFFGPVEMVPTNSVYVGQTYSGLDVYELELDFEAQFGQLPFLNNYYWLALTGEAVGSGSIGWVTSTEINNDINFYYLVGDEWFDGATGGYPFDLAFSVLGDCYWISTNETDQFKFSYYQDSKTNQLIIDSEIGIQNTEAYDMNGRSVLKEVKIGKIDLSRIPAGVYFFKVLLDGNRIETFRIIKR